VLEPRWLRWTGPGVIALLAIGLLASTTLGAGQKRWEPPDCPAGADRVGAARSPAIAIGDLRSVPWYRIDPRLDRTGTLAGQRLAIGLDGDRSSQYLDLAAESFAAGPFGRVILIGADDGAASNLAAIDVAGQCSFPIASETAVIRRATIAPDGRTIYQMRVDRATREDLGIWARPIDGSPAVRVIEPIGSDERFGRTFTTELAWSVAEDRLAIQSCGEAACRTRLFDPASGRIDSVAEPDLGALIGHQDGIVVTYGACPGFPCPIVATNVSTGARATLSEGSALAVLVATPDGTRLVHEQVGAAGLVLRSVALDGSAATDVGAPPSGFRLNATEGAVSSATDLPASWVLLSPDARLPGTGPLSQTLLRRVPDGVSVELEEIVR